MPRKTAFLNDSITKAKPNCTAHKKIFLLSSNGAIIIMKSISSSYDNCLG